MRLLSIAACAAALVFDLESQERSRAPNIVFLLADDLGWADVAPNNPGTF